MALATTPTVVSTFFSHVLSSHKRKSAEKKSVATGGPGGGPESQLSYEEGLKVVRRFLDFASHHGVEEVQAFTGMGVPVPRKSRANVSRSGTVVELSSSQGWDPWNDETDIKRSRLGPPSGRYDTTGHNISSRRCSGEAPLDIRARRRERGRSEVARWGEMVEGQGEGARRGVDRGERKSVLWSSPACSTGLLIGHVPSDATGFPSLLAGRSPALLLPQMQKDYLRRISTAQHPVASSSSSVPVPTAATSAHHNHYLPRRSATLGSVKDNSGAEVIGDRVILYIHGKWRRVAARSTADGIMVISVLV